MLINTLKYIKIKQGIFFVFIAIVLMSCSVMRQASELQTFTKCEFRLKTVEDIRLADVDVQKISKMSELSISDFIKLTISIATGDFSLNFILNVEVKNPNTSKAALNKLDWILYIDDIEMTHGLLEQRTEIAPDGGISAMPLKIGVNLYDVLSGESADAIINFGLNLAGTGNRPTRIMLKARPTIYINGKPIKYPGYVRVRDRFTSE